MNFKLQEIKKLFDISQTADFKHRQVAQMICQIQFQTKVFICHLFFKWYSEEGGTIIEYFYKLKDLSNLKQQTISNSQKPQMLVDQILIEKITEFNISQVYYFYLSFNSTDLMYYLNYKIWTNKLNAERFIEKFYKDDLILDSFVIDEELFLFLQNKTFQTIYSISNEQINLREKLNFSQVQLSHQIKVYRDFFNYFQIMVNQYNNFELYFNSADQSKIQITKTSRNPRLVCAQKAGQQHYVSLFEKISEMNLYYSKEILISVYLKYNSTRLEVIFEEFDYRESISDEIRISNDADYLVVKKQPKVIKKGFYYFISYLNQQIAGLYQRDLVILNDDYQQCSRNIIASGLSAESDVYVTDTLSIYFFSIYTNHTEKYLRLQYYQFLNGNIQEQSNWQEYNEYNDEVQLKNLRFGSTQINSVVPLDHFITFDEVHQTLSGSVNHIYLQQYQNGFQYQTVLYDIINSTQVNLQFFNDNQVFQKEYIIYITFSLLGVKIQSINPIEHY